MNLLVSILFCSTDLIYLSIPVQISYCFYCYSFLMYLNISRVDFSPFPILAQADSALLG